MPARSTTVVKNTFLNRAAREAGFPDLGASLSGQTAIVTGDKDVSAAAKVLRTFATESKKMTIRAGVVDKSLFTDKQLSALADLPSKEVLQSQLLGLAPDARRPGWSRRSTSLAQAWPGCSRPTWTSKAAHRRKRRHKSEKAEFSFPPFPVFPRLEDLQNFRRETQPSQGRPTPNQHKKRFLVGLAAAGLKLPGALGNDDHHNITERMEGAETFPYRRPFETSWLTQVH